ncbi:MAG: HAMP domain-containing histidine kinase, partial [Rhodospirillales bacterium]|nr:HAMP domain-containing histidine kinase [Rhodospirillales bacterium]
MMRRLYLQIFLAFVTILIVAIGTTMVVGRLLRDDDGPPPMLDSVARLLIDDLRSPGLPPGEQQARFRDRCNRLGIEAVLLDADDEPVLSCAPGHGKAAPPWPRGSGGGRGWRRHAGKSGMLVDVGEGQRLWAVPMRPFHRDLGRVLGGLTIVTLILAAGSYLLARRVTRRLAAVEVGVRSWGEGDLTARAPVSGRDEVASVARAFNAAADKVVSLLDQQRRTLAHASHELRSPLARLRMAIELLAEPPPPGSGSATDDPSRQRLRGEAERNIEELDALVEELLMAARLDGGGGTVVFDEVNLDLLVAAECERRKIAFDGGGAPRLVRGDSRLLLRVLRNLLDNADRHAGGATAVELRGEEGRAV